MLTKDDAKRIVQKHFIDVSQEEFEATLYRANPWLKEEQDQARAAKSGLPQVQRQSAQAE